MIGVIVVAALSYVAGAQSFRLQTWPFGRGYYAELAERLGLPLAVSHSAFHNFRTTFFSGIAEGHIEGIKTEAGVFSFLHFAITGELSLGRLDLAARTLEMQRLGAVKGVVRAAGMLRLPGEGNLYVSYAAVDGKGCAALKLDHIGLNGAGPLRQTPLFQSSCAPPPSFPDHAGGRMQMDQDGRLYVSVGEFGRGDIADDPSNNLGRILAGKPDEGLAVYSRGHRNVQGLLWDADFKRLLATEHGPLGGDEINVILPNAHYGWPHESYGRPYSNASKAHYAKSATYGRHDQYKKPLYAYVPSIGIAQIRKMPRDATEFPEWRSQYFVAGMAERSKSLTRLVIESDRVILSEPIRLGRFRDFAITDSGVIVASLRPNGLLLIRRKDD